MKQQDVSRRRTARSTSKGRDKPCCIFRFKWTIERILLLLLLIVYLGFSVWTWRLVPPDGRQHQQQLLQSTMMVDPSATTKDTSIQAKKSIHGTATATTPSHHYKNNANTTTTQLERLSSVDFYACCGLGHRLIRMSLAAYVAKQRNFALRAFWGWCGERHPVEVFSYLFHPQSPSELQHVTSQNMVLPFYNEVPGFPSLVRKGNSSNVNSSNNGSEQMICPCVEDKIASDLEFYLSLRDRFRAKKVVDEFVAKHFANATVIGIHVRSGNGEGGDFERKGRNIVDPDAWVRQVRTLFQNNLLSQPLHQPPVLYVATDTPSMVTRFRQHFAEINVPVFDLPQQGRRSEGAGVLFGEGGMVHNKGNGDESVNNEDDDYSSCLRGWSDTITDMLLLSHADVVIAGRPSSFVQTAPMALAFGKPLADRKLRDVYCEIIPQHEQVSQEWVEIAPTMHCFDSYKRWCCGDQSTWIKFHHNGPQGHQRVISREFLRFPTPEEQGSVQKYRGLRMRAEKCPRPRRGRAGGGLKDKCLPHAW